VQFYSSADSSNKSAGVNMVVYSQVWIAAVVSLLLAVLTMLLWIFWDQRRSRIEDRCTEDHVDASS
jgi:hypothetical protein